MGAADGFQFRAPIRAGSVYALPGVLLPGQRAEPGTGYDGQFYFYLAEDPFLRNPETARSLDNTFRVRRWLYPLLGHVFSGGRRGAVPVALVAINVAALATLTWLLALAALRAGRRPWVALLPVAYAGSWIPLLLDLTEPVQLVLLAAGMLSGSAGLLLGAALAKETAGVALLTEGVRALADRRWGALARHSAAAAIYLGWALAVFLLVRGTHFNSLGAHFLDPAGAPFLTLLKGPSHLLTALPAVLICCLACARLVQFRDGPTVAAAAYAVLALGAGYDTWLDPAAFLRVTAGALVLIYLSWCRERDPMGTAALAAGLVAGLVAGVAVFG